MEREKDRDSSRNKSRSRERNNDRRIFIFRSNFLLLLIGLWAVAAAAHVFYYSVWTRTSLLEESGRIAWREGTLPALRGRILDRNGVVLAWTELHYDLYLETLPVRDRRLEQLALRLREDLDYSFTRPLSLLEPNMILKRDLSPEEVRICGGLMKTFPELRVRMRFERLTVDYPSLRDRIGECLASEDGELRGVSGLEAEYDASLRGTPGKFIVMLDKYGNWFEGTLQMKRGSIPGGDVRLEISLNSILSADGDKGD